MRLQRMSCPCLRTTQGTVCVCVLRLCVFLGMCTCVILRAWFASVNVSLCVCTEFRGPVSSLIRTHTKWLHAAVPHLTSTMSPQQIPLICVYLFTYLSSNAGSGSTTHSVRISGERSRGTR
jgi:hypothetical protein